MTRSGPRTAATSSVACSPAAARSCSTTPRLPFRPAAESDGRYREVMTDTNRLAQETSPYLRQHAENPVDWYPWGPEAFAAASERNVPILLSVGYPACH